jgi:hypothetical protein
MSEEEWDKVCIFFSLHITFQSTSHTKHRLQEENALLTDVNNSAGPQTSKSPKPSSPQPAQHSKQTPRVGT